jgi:hypothetical protein
LKKLFYLLTGLFSLTSCSSLKKASTSAPASSNVKENKDPRFIENISIAPGKPAISSSESKETYHTVYAKAEIANLEENPGIESANSLQIKYAILLNLPVETTFNIRMLEFIEEWYGTPYRYGGTSKKGVDCSAFVNFFMSAVYGLDIPRNSKEQYDAAKKIKKKQLEEGDLVFFNTRRGISHVGVYIGNNKFVHASTSNGVIISDLDDDYFSRRYIGSGRLR